MSERFSLEAQPRQVFGKQVKTLRAAGQIPGVIYGEKQDPVHVQMPWSKLRVLLNNAGGSNLVDVDVAGKVYTTLIRVVDRHPVRRDVLHVDFQAVDLTHKITTAVSVTMVGDDEVRQKTGGRVTLEVVSLQVECLPTDIPNEIIIDARALKHVNEAIHVKDLPVIKGVTYLDAPDAVLVRVTATFTEEGVSETIESEDEMAEPEVIHKGKEEGEDEE